MKPGNIPAGKILETTQAERYGLREWKIEEVDENGK